jgi:hypothetical protein
MNLLRIYNKNILSLSLLQVNSLKIHQNTRMGRLYMTLRDSGSI